MSQFIVVNREGAEAVVEGEAGLTLMEIIRDAGFDELLAMCGGCLSCATCHVYVEGEAVAALPEIGEDEDDLLGAVESRKEGSRLSCQIPFSPEMAGLRVTIAPEQ